MKILFVLFVLVSVSEAQVGTTTFVPDPPVAGQPLQLIVSTSTPHQGSKLTRTVVVNTNYLPPAGSSTITINMCNFYGYLTSPKSFLDTFNINPLPAGPGTLFINYSMSMQSDQCIPDTTISAAIHYTVVNSTTAAIGEIVKTTTQLFPNPASELVLISGHSGF